MKILEIRASLLEKDAKDTHTKHVTVVITDPTFCSGFQSALDQLLGNEQDALGIDSKDQFTLENCADASSFHLSGKKNMTAEEKQLFLTNRKKKGAA